MMDNIVLTNKYKMFDEQFDDFEREYPKFFPLELSNHEIQFIISECVNVKSYLEFGAGGSTFLSLLNFKKISKIISVESDPNWIVFLKKWTIINKACEENRLHFEYVDIGKTGEWGVPIGGNGAEQKYPDYSSTVFKKEYVQNNSYDLVFIDGRFRVACLLQTVLNVPSTTRIMIHDFCNRPEYHVVLKYVNVIEPMDTLCLFKIKDNINKDEVLSDYHKYKFISD